MTEDRREQPFRVCAGEGELVRVAHAGRAYLDEYFTSARPFDLDLADLEWMLCLDPRWPLSLSFDPPASVRAGILASARSSGQGPLASTRRLRQANRVSSETDVEQPTPDRAVFEFICTQAIPHNRELGVQLVDVSRGAIELALPYDERLIGNPATGVLAGGVITSLLDAACGMAVMAATIAPKAVATLDLRIDYMKPAPPGQTVHARADCYKVTSHVAFVRAEAFADDPDDLIATAAGSFMMNTAGRPLSEGGGS